MSGLQDSKLKIIQKTFKKLIAFNNPSQKQNFSEEIAKIKEHLKNRDNQNVYALANALLLRSPTNEFASYAAALGATRLGLLNEVTRLIAPAIAAKPKNLKYLSLRGNAYLKQKLYKEAHADFEEMALITPDEPTVWKALLKIRSELKIDVPPPRIFTVINDEIGNSYNKKDWTSYNRLVSEMLKLEPITGRYWQLLSDDLFMRVGDPSKEWELLHEKCRESDHKLSFSAFYNMMNSLIKTGDLRLVLPELPKFKILYNKSCPPILASAVCALFLRNNQYEQCLTFIDECNINSLDPNTKLTLQLRTFAYRWVCREKLGLKQKAKNSNSTNVITDGLFKEMEILLIKGSASEQTVESCIKCWEDIRQSSSELLQDLRFNSEQLSNLKNKILNSLSQKKPLSLLRLMDGESYGFMNDLTDDVSIQISKQIEHIWWGRDIDSSCKKKMIEDFFSAIKSADIIGFPSALRLSQVLDVENKQDMSTSEIKYQKLFLGVKKLLAEEGISKNICWVDEFCGFAMTDTTYISQLIEASNNVVIVTCFKIPQFHIFDHPKVTIINIPPHTKVASTCGTEFGDKVLPEVIEDIKKQLHPLLKPGSLLLVGAGFAGKTLMDVAKKSGSVALDLGAAIDDMLGYKTRATELHAQFSALPTQQKTIKTSHGNIQTNLPTKVLIKLEDASKFPGVNWRSYYAGNRQRFSLATGVKFLNENTLVVSSLLARKIYLVRFDFEMGTFRIIDGITTTFNGQPTETDLLDIDNKANIIVSNCGNGSLGCYRYEADKLTFVKDILLYPKSFIHGVKLLGDIAAASIISDPLGIHFVDINTSEIVFHVPTEIKAKDVCFLSDTKMVILTTYGKLTTEVDEGYDSELQLVDFDLKTKTYKILRKTIFKNCHFDCVVHHEDNLFVNEQFSGVVFMVTPETLEKVGEISGYDFPHGIDIKYGMIAVTNYGSNSVDIRQI